MLTRSHRICSIAIVELSLLLTNRLLIDPVNNIIILAATAIGASLPDIDEYNSSASKKSVINFSLFLKHRGITHSFLGWAIFSGGLYYLMNKFIPIHINNLTSQNYWSALWFGLVIGYFLHLVEDSFSKQGVEWLAPFYKKKESHQFIIKLEVALRTFNYDVLFSGNYDDLLLDLAFFDTCNPSLFVLKSRLKPVR